jgi:hypothetical protein
MASTHTFHFDDRTEKTVKYLKTFFPAKTKSEVIRKSLALSLIIQQHKNQETNSIVIGEGKSQKVIVLS